MPQLFVFAAGFIGALLGVRQLALRMRNQHLDVIEAAVIEAGGSAVNINYVETPQRLQQGYSVAFVAHDGTRQLRTVLLKTQASGSIREMIWNRPIVDYVNRSD